MPNEIIENSSNSELVMELIGVLNKETSLFETFLELLEEQQKALVANDVSTLNNVTANQREKVIEANLLARKRQDVIGKLALEHDMTGDVSIGKLIDSVNSGQASLLEKLRNAILELNDKISLIRSQNEMLINRSRENIMKTMELLGRFKKSSGGYHKNGASEKSGINIALDRRA
jgi:hypothetical protein